MTHTGYPHESVTLSDVLVSRARTDAERIVFAERDERVTFARFFEEARDLANGLLLQGVRPGDRIILSMNAGLDFLRAFWAIQLTGAISCAFNPYVPAATTAARALRIKPAAVVTDSEAAAGAVRNQGLQALLFAEITRGPGALPPHGRNGEDIAILQPTSGTSGESRAAMIRHRNVLRCIDSSIEALQFNPSDVLVAWVPPWHDLGLIRFVVGTVYFGARTHVVQPAIQTIPEWFETMSRERCTVTGAPDFAWRLATRFVDPARVDLTSLRDATNGGEPVRPSTVEMFARTFGVEGAMLPGYGLAEATLGVSCLLPGEPVRTDERGNVSCGRPLPLNEVKLAEGTNEILVRGDLVFAGYFEAEEATRETLRDGWLHTGDIGHFDADGHLYVLGRKRAMLKRGGAILAPRELEDAAQQVPGVKIAAAVALTAAESTEQIALVIVVDEREDPGAISAGVAQSVRGLLGFAPDRVIVLKKGSIPRTYNGKLRHDALRAALADGSLAAAVLTTSNSPGAG
jgi:acyl-CoA synthetase (AMP-forming)/AMP-acid ligase II